MNHGQERRSKVRRLDDLTLAERLTDEDRDALVKALAPAIAAEAFKQFQLAVGRSVVRNVLILLVLAIAGVWAYVTWWAEHH